MLEQWVDYDSSVSPVSNHASSLVLRCVRLLKVNWLADNWLLLQQAGSTRE
jgi:hypothetical protein